MGRSRSLGLLIALAIWCAADRSAVAQETSGSTAQPEATQETQGVREVGGRLVASGETVVVRGESDQPPRDSSVATKIETPLIETPRSITIVDRQTLDDMAIVNITQAHDYTVGLSPQDERGPAFARGFPVDFYDLRRDGLRTYSWSVREPVALDRIQYLRGPSSVLYGDGSPGALINLVLNKPLPVRRVDVSGSVGSLGFGRLSADATGPLNAARTVRYRLIASGEWLENGFDNGERRFTVFPSLAVDLGSTSTLSFDTEIYRQRGRNYRHVVPATADAQRGDFSAYPWDLSAASPDDGWSGGNVSPGVRLDVRLGPRTSLHVAGRYTRIDGDIDLQALAGVSPDGNTALRYHYREISIWDEYQSDAFATTTARTGGNQHRLVAGIETGLSTTDSQIGVNPAAPLDIDDPIYGPQPPPPPLSPVRFDVTRPRCPRTRRSKLAQRRICSTAASASRGPGFESVARTCLKPIPRVSIGRLAKARVMASSWKPSVPLREASPRGRDTRGHGQRSRRTRSAPLVGSFPTRRTTKHTCGCATGLSRLHFAG